MKILKSITLIVVGTFILSFGTAVFLVPFNLVAGGMSGIAIVIRRLVSAEFLTIDLIVTVLTWTLFFLGFAVLGRAFALKTLVSSLVYPIAFSLSMRLTDASVLGGYFNLQSGEHSEIAFLLASIVGGALVGVGSAIAFLGGGSTGGTDIIAFIICRFFPKLRSSKVIFIVDAAIVALGMFVMGDLVVSLLGVICALVCAIVIDKVFLGGSAAFVAQIISEKYEDINRAVIQSLERTTSIIEIVGGYTGEKKKMVVVSFTMREYAELMNLINQNDKLAFITVHRAHEVGGEGWSR